MNKTIKKEWKKSVERGNLATLIQRHTEKRRSNSLSVDDVGERERSSERDKKWEKEEEDRILPATNK